MNVERIFYLLPFLVFLLFFLLFFFDLFIFFLFFLFVFLFFLLFFPPGIYFSGMESKLSLNIILNSPTVVLMPSGVSISISSSRFVSIMSLYNFLPFFTKFIDFNRSISAVFLSRLVVHNLSGSLSMILPLSSNTTSLYVDPE